MRKIALLCLFAAIAAHAEISAGLIGGAPFTDVVNATSVSGVQYAASSANFTIGPAIRVGLPASLRFEVDALYRPYAFTASSAGTNPSGSQWRFPVLLEYRFRNIPVVKPFVLGGVSFSHVTNLSSAIAAGPVKFLQASDSGAILGFGADVKVPLVTLSGEFRYSRQGNYFSGLSNLNQAEVLFGIHF